jgi:hypothetical protein
MYQTNLTEMFRERELALRREAQERRHSRSHRGGRRRMAAFRRLIALWERTSLIGFHPPEGGRSGTASSRVAAR